MDIKAEFERLSPWKTKFTINNSYFGGDYSAHDDPRLLLFLEKFRPLNKILELGSFEGGHTVALRQNGVKEVVAVEARKSNIQKSEFIKSIFEIENITFIEADLETYNISNLGKFDAVFCVGVLYHLTNPTKTLSQISKISNQAFIWTHYSENESKYVREGGLEDPLSGTRAHSLWLSIEEFKSICVEAGFHINELLLQSNDNGPALIAILKKQSISLI